MGVQNIGKEDFQQTVAKGGILFIDWWAPWCGPCRAFAPVYEKVAETNPDATFAKINTDEEQELAAAFNIRSIPTLMIFRDKVLLFAQPGALSQNMLEELVRKVRSSTWSRCERGSRSSSRPGRSRRRSASLVKQSSLSCLQRPRAGATLLRTAATISSSLGNPSAFFSATAWPSTSTMKEPTAPTSSSACNPSSFSSAAAARAARGL